MLAMRAGAEACNSRWRSKGLDYQIVDEYISFIGMRVVYWNSYAVTKSSRRAFTVVPERNGR